jgi:glutamine cyclotransferase
VRRWRLVLAVLGLIVACSACAVWSWTRTGAGGWYRYEVVHEYPHDEQAYCQGLVFEDGVIYEGTGKYGESSLRRVRYETGEILQSTALDRRYFGEGIVIWKGKILQLTWQERVALVYDKQTLKPTGQVFRYQGEGWGLTTDGQSLIMSDGTSVLRFLDPETFKVQRRLTVREGRQRVTNLNELEYIQGEIYANVWKQDYIVRISPRTGEVTSRIDLRGLRPAPGRWGDDNVLNGIAYDAAGDRLFVTGKNWPKLYEIRLIPAEDSEGTARQ